MNLLIIFFFSIFSFYTIIILKRIVDIRNKQLTKESKDSTIETLEDEDDDHNE